MKMRSYIKKHSLALILAMTGAVCGFLYWKFVGCKSGSCPIKSNWYLMTIWGTVFGYLLGDIISEFIKKRSKASQEQD